jgi:hypothetical protein
LRRADLGRWGGFGAGDGGEGGLKLRRVLGGEHAGRAQIRDEAGDGGEALFLAPGGVHHVDQGEGDEQEGGEEGGEEHAQEVGRDILGNAGLGLKLGLGGVRIAHERHYK